MIHSPRKTKIASKLNQTVQRSQETAEWYSIKNVTGISLAQTGEPSKDNKPHLTNDTKNHPHTNEPK